ncbi:phage head-tail connector protein [Clostridium botulinum]|nr:phage head-tail connector protein [Clostridium botulinum]
MLENIKMILGIQDDSKDNIINYYIKRYTDKILSYCHLRELPHQLEGFIEEKVINIVNNIIQNEQINEEKKNIKSIQRGDTRIEFKACEEKNINSLLVFNSTDIKELNKFRKVAW